MKKITTTLCRLFTCTFLGVACAMSSSYAGIAAGQSMQELSDKEMAGVAGQALFVNDKIPGEAGSGHTFYRMGLDTELALNANIDRLQLGCGGVNNNIDPNRCDIDMEYVRLMGLCDNQADPGCGQTSPDGFPIAGAGDPVDSDFVLTRPYIEIAVKNDGTTNREVAGIKIGSETANGYFGVGQALCGNNDAACHRGINSISGYMNIEVSFEMPVTLHGWVTTSSSTLYAGDTPGSNTGPIFREISGTRMHEIRLPGLPATPQGGLADTLGDEVYVDLREDLSFIHGFQLQDTGDFFLSFQREQVRYPKADKSGYAKTANTGWWMNVPDVKMTDLRPPRYEATNCGVLYVNCLPAFNQPGLPVRNIDLGSRPPQNCRGSALFC